MRDIAFTIEAFCKVIGWTLAAILIIAISPILIAGWIIRKATA